VIWRLVRDCAELDDNSFYAYYVLCSRFSATCAVAEQEGRVVGFALAFLGPDDPDVCFVWQLYVVPGERGAGFATDLLDYLVSSQPRPPLFVEATVAPGNTASRRAFQALARRFRAEVAESPCLSSADFPDSAEEHAAEDMLRIGPLRQS